MHINKMCDIFNFVQHNLYVVILCYIVIINRIV